MDQHGTPTPPSRLTPGSAPANGRSPMRPSDAPSASRDEADWSMWQADGDGSISLATDDHWPGPFGAAARGMP